MDQREQLELPRCPRCGIARPLLSAASKGCEEDRQDVRKRHWWIVYICSFCKQSILATWQMDASPASWPPPEVLPSDHRIDEAIPEQVRECLEESLSSRRDAPRGSIVMAAAAVDAMLKARGYDEGGLHARIESAAAAHLITDEMKAWAHEVRLDANAERHVDDDRPPTTSDDAGRSIQFALALAEYLFVLPARVQRGRGAGD